MVPLLVLAMMSLADTWAAQLSSAAPASTPCSGWNGHYLSGRKEYNCSFDRTSSVRNKYNTQVGTMAAGTNWVICQAKGSTVRLASVYYNYWWAYTMADNGSMGWVNAVYGSGGDNYGTFSGVPVCAATSTFTPPTVGTPPPPPPPPPTTGTGAAILRAALSQRGLPYVWAGGNQYGPTNGGFDCSGLVMYSVYQATHKVLYHQAAYQWQNSAGEGATRVSLSSLAPGDIVFFPAGATANSPGHVAVYYGVVNGNPTVVDAYDYGVPLGLHTFSQEGSSPSGAIRF